MVRIIFISIIFSILTLQIISAQKNTEAEKIISELLTSAKTSAIKTSFKLISLQKKDPIPQISSGTFTLKGTKFVLEMEAMKVWFDGKTQWAYVHQSNEVSITEPSEKELSETNPMAILSGFKAKSFIRFSTKVKSNQNYCIELTPKTSQKDIQKIEVQVNKSNENLFSIKITNKNGDESVLTLSNYQKGLDINENTFVFNALKYKGVTINDLR